MGRPQPTKPPTIQPPPDPLADLRADDAPPPEVQQGEAPGEETEAVEIRPMVSQGTWDEMVAEAVAAWHMDPTSQGFLHGGGQCGCFYIARQALRVAVPVMTEEDQEERELEPSDG